MFKVNQNNMAFAPAQFNVVFGFSQSPLTEALESRDFEQASEYIDNHYGSCLDEGYYRRIPLYIVLSGEKSCSDGKAMPVHLKIARCLIERGADPTLRIPKSLGSEYIGPGRSPLECVVDVFNSVSGYDKNNLEDPAPQFPVILMNGKKCESVKDLMDDLVTMVWILLGKGAEINIRDVENKTPLHNTIIRSADLGMAQVLCDNGANVNAVDRSGNTPLMALCNPMPWRYFDDYGPSVGGYDISNALLYLLRLEDTQINHCGIHGRTALFYAMQSGNLEVARMLLDRGANPNMKGMGPEGSYISPLLAALVPWTDLDRKDVKRNLKAVSSLVDEGFFSTPEILKEVLEYAVADDSKDDLLPKLLDKGVELIQLLFGQITCPLTQLTARTAAEYKFPKLGLAVFSTMDIIKFVHSQGLPLELISHFQVVLLREKILSSLSDTDWDVWDIEEFSLYDSDDYDESEDEFW